MFSSVWIELQLVLALADARRRSRERGAAAGCGAAGRPVLARPAARGGAAISSSVALRLLLLGRPCRTACTRATACRTSAAIGGVPLHDADARIGREHADPDASIRRSAARSRASPSARAAASPTTDDRTPAPSSRHPRVGVAGGRRVRRVGDVRRPRPSCGGDLPCDADADAAAVRHARERVDLLRTPSSAISKSGADRSVTGRPFRSRTTTSTRIAVVVDVKDWRAACGAAPCADPPPRDQQRAATAASAMTHAGDGEDSASSGGQLQPSQLVHDRGASPTGTPGRRPA